MHAIVSFVEKFILFTLMLKDYVIASANILVIIHTSVVLVKILEISSNRIVEQFLKRECGFTFSYHLHFVTLIPI